MATTYTNCTACCVGTTMCCLSTSVPTVLYATLSNFSCGCASPVTFPIYLDFPTGPTPCVWSNYVSLCGCYLFLFMDCTIGGGLVGVNVSWISAPGSVNWFDHVCGGLHNVSKSGFPSTSPFSLSLTGLKACIHAIGLSPSCPGGCGDDCTFDVVITE